MTFLKEKSKAFLKFKDFKALVENKANRKIKCLRLDNGGEFTSNEFNEFNSWNQEVVFNRKIASAKWSI